MKLLSRLLAATLLLTLIVPFGAREAEGQTKVAAKKSKIRWQKTVIDTVFRSEGVGVADLNKDGKMDIFVGDVWYEAPDWKMHEVRTPKKYDAAKGYSESFACFPGDFNGDGYPDMIVIPFPGAPCFWYENPGAKGGKWIPHLLASSACNETPIYVDLFGTGSKVLVMGWQPPDKNDQGQMCYFIPGKDPTQPWQKLPISEPSQPGKEIPGTRKFSHGLGHGDVNGDGRADIIVADGWWEQPAKVDAAVPWTFHPANLNPVCADMFTYDIDGDGKADIVSSSAHGYGFWWHQQKPGPNGPAFVLHDLFPPPAIVTKLSKDLKQTPEELALYHALNKFRNDQGRAPWRLNNDLSSVAAAQMAAANGIKAGIKNTFQGKVIGQAKLLNSTETDVKNAVKLLMADLEKQPGTLSPALEVGVATVPSKAPAAGVNYAVYLGNAGAFSLPAQTHALHCVDINGDGLKDFVTGRRWSAHGPRGDAGPNDPACLYWFEARRDPTGFTTFVPHEIDDDSGIGTTFAVADMNGDGLPDIIISNKKGVFLFIQVRED